jgi:hypothetical protein
MYRLCDTGQVCTSNCLLWCDSVMKHGGSLCTSKTPTAWVRRCACMLCALVQSKHISHMHDLCWRLFWVYALDNQWGQEENEQIHNLRFSQCSFLEYGHTKLWT